MVAFADKVRFLERVRQHLRRRFGELPRLAVTHPVEHAIRAILSEEAASAEVDDAIDRLHRHFVDLNDLRVSRPREIREVLGGEFPRSGHKARVIPRLLDQVFKQHNSMVWDFLEEMGKTEARAYFEKLEDVRPFVAATMARDCVGAHAVPVDNDVSRALGRLGIVGPATESEAEMQTILERAVKANRAYEVHWLAKRLGEDLCIVGTPLCRQCPLNSFCPSAAIPSRTRAKKKAAAKPSKPAAKKKPKAAARKKRR